MPIIPEITVTQMREVDRLMVESFHIHLLQMMENAGRLLARVARERFRPKSVVILAGKGNNGGGGLVAARYLRNFGVEVQIMLSEEALRPVPAMHLKAAEVIGIPVARQLSSKPDLVIDALLGYNGTGATRGKTAELIEQANALGVPILCLDVPSGFDASAGRWYSPAFKNATVLTLGLPKTNMLGNPEIKTLLVGDIGIPQKVYQYIGLKVPTLFAEQDTIEA